MNAPRKLRIRILFGPDIVVGPGKMALLEAIAETGSISAAARKMGMSYRRAWMLVDTMNRCFREAVVVTAAGGKGGGGAKVTALGRDVMARYRRMERRAADAVADDVAAFSVLLAPPSGE